MKIKIVFSLILAALFCGVTAQAEQFNLQKEATEEIMNALNDEGIFADMSNNEVANVEEFVNTLVVSELANIGNLNLSENAKQAFLGGILDKVKKVVSKGVEAIKRGAAAAVAKVRELAPKVLSVAKQYGPQLIALGKKVLPAALPIIAAVATKAGAPENLVKGVAGLLSPADQTNPEKVAEKVAEVAKNPEMLAAAAR